MINAIQRLLQHDTAGDPQSDHKWTRTTTAKIAAQLTELGLNVSPNTVGRLLYTLRFRLRVNHKKRSGGCTPDRDEQFRYIASLRQQFAQAGHPIISVDTKKKELVGNFKNPGAVWSEQPRVVNDHDFRSDALGMAIPYGVYDLLDNSASVFVGMSHDTSEFAVDSVETWWRDDGKPRYPHAQRVLILSDGGGSNGYQRKSWKLGLQAQLADRHRLSVTVAHYPTGASKWNPIEHRLFSEISKHWAGEPLVSYQAILGLIANTTTATGLRVRPYLVEKPYATGVTHSDKEMAQLAIERPAVQPHRNYTIHPR